MTTDTDVPVKPKRTDDDFRPSAVVIAQALEDLAQHKVVRASNAGLAAATGFGKPRHNAVTVYRALRAMTRYGLIERQYDPRTRERAILILADDLVGEVRSRL